MSFFYKHFKGDKEHWLAINSILLHIDSIYYKSFIL